MTFTFSYMCNFECMIKCFGGLKDLILQCDDSFIYLYTQYLSSSGKIKKMKEHFSLTIFIFRSWCVSFYFGSFLVLSRNKSKYNLLLVFTNALHIVGIQYIICWTGLYSTFSECFTAEINHQWLINNNS